MLVALAVAALSPDIADGSLSDGRNLAYLAVVSIIGGSLFASMALVRPTSRHRTAQRAAYAILVVTAAGLLSAAWQGVGTTVILVIVATAFSYAGMRLTETGQPGWEAFHAALALLWAWMAIGALSAFSLQGLYALPVGATIAAAGAFVVSENLETRRVDSLTVAVVAILGAEMVYALSFSRIDPFVSATLWLAGFGLAFALLSIFEVKVER